LVGTRLGFDVLLEVGDNRLEEIDTPSDGGLGISEVGGAANDVLVGGEEASTKEHAEVGEAAVDNGFGGHEGEFTLVEARDDARGGELVGLDRSEAGEDHEGDVGSNLDGFEGLHDVEGGRLGLAAGSSGTVGIDQVLQAVLVLGGTRGSGGKSSLVDEQVVGVLNARVNIEEAVHLEGDSLGLGDQVQLNFQVELHLNHITHDFIEEGTEDEVTEGLGIGSLRLSSLSRDDIEQATFDGASLLEGLGDVGDVGNWQGAVDGTLGTEEGVDVAEAAAGSILDHFAGGLDELSLDTFCGSLEHLGVLLDAFGEGATLVEVGVGDGGDEVVVLEVEMAVEGLAVDDITGVEDALRERLGIEDEINSRVVDEEHGDGTGNDTSGSREGLDGVQEDVPVVEDLLLLELDEGVEVGCELLVELLGGGEGSEIGLLGGGSTRDPEGSVLAEGLLGLGGFTRTVPSVNSSLVGLGESVDVDVLGAEVVKFFLSEDHE